jgi:hypothetical protein
MIRSRGALLGALAVAAVVGSCSAAARIPMLRPPTVATTGYTAPFKLVRQPARQLGIGIDFYTYPGQPAVAEARYTAAYVATLHANSVAITFPYFMHGPSAHGVYASPATPSPETLAAVAAVFEHAGLYVTIRPLLDETSLGQSRTIWKPTARARQAWFASYRRFLLPYAKMAQQAQIPGFVDGTEFSQFGWWSNWNQLATALRQVYKGRISYDNNWSAQKVSMAGEGGKGVTEAVDAYRPIAVPASASVGRLIAGWRAYDATLPRGTVETEVDIAAVRGAYSAPFSVGRWKGVRHLTPTVQIRWFEGACDGVATRHLGGIYFWGIGLGRQVRPSLANPAAWAGGPGARAVAACFRKLR